MTDENLSSRLVAAVGDIYAGSAHVADLGLLGATDRDLWAQASAAGFVLVTKDEDFHRLSVLLGPPPKVIWVRLGNCRKQALLAAVERLWPKIETCLKAGDRVVELR